MIITKVLTKILLLLINSIHCVTKFFTLRVRRLFEEGDGRRLFESWTRQRIAGLRRIVLSTVLLVVIAN